MAGKGPRRYFGSVRKLPSGRFQARYKGPDGQTYTARRPDGGPLTFASKPEAEAWLATKQTDILRGAWLPPAAPASKPQTFGAYAERWLAGRNLAPLSRKRYSSLLRDKINPTFERKPLTAITPTAVREWYDGLPADKPGAKRAAYALLRTICNTALREDLLTTSPCRIVGAAANKRVRKVRPATLPELDVLVQNFPPPLRLMVLLAAWCALRFGELVELRRGDIDLTNRLLSVHRGAVHPKGECIIGDPKSEAGIRDIAIPPHLIPAIETHLATHVRPAKNSLLFQPTRGGCHINQSSLHYWYYPARKAAGRPDLRWHDLRHTGATLAAVSGATLAELMARLGHSTASAAMVYQHAAADRDQVIAAALSQLATAPRGEVA